MQCVHVANSIGEKTRSSDLSPPRAVHVIQCPAVKQTRARVDGKKTSNYFAHRPRAVSIFRAKRGGERVFGRWRTYVEMSGDDMVGLID